MRLTALLFLIATLSCAAFAQSATVKGKVKDEDERSLSGVTIELDQDGKKLKDATTDSKGEFFLSGLSDGIYVLKFDKDGYGGGSYRFEIKKGKGGDLGNKNFLLPKDRGIMIAIQGTVFDQDGFSLPGAKVEIARMTAGKVWEKLKAVYTGQEGEFIVRFPPNNSEANYRVTVTYKDAAPQIKEKTTDSPGIYRLAFNMPIKRQAQD